ncbi:MAG: hypothetical protein ABSA30_04725 [Candidatus Aminicenantales bacterium]|jgi:hypothetical protein
MSKKRSYTLVVSILAFGLAMGAAAAAAQDQSDKAKISRNTYALITETDLYCAFFVLDKEPATRILAPNTGERLLLSDADQFYGGPVGEWREGQIFQIVEIGPSVPGVRGNIGFGRGRAKILRVENGRFLAQIEKSCGPVHIGDGLVPFEKKTAVEGKDLGYRGVLQGGDVLTGRIIFLPDDHAEIGADCYALIDRGLEAGLQPGQQLTVFGASSGGKFPQAVGNAVVIGAGRTTATIKVLSLKTIIQMGDVVQIK